MVRAIVVCAIIVCPCAIAAAEDYTPIDRSGMEAVSDYSHPDYPVSDAIDDDTGTFWYNVVGHWIRIDMKARHEITMVRHLPRNDQPIKDYDLYVTNDPDDWGTAVSSGAIPQTNDATDIPITPTTGRYVVLDVTSSWGGTASVAELYLFGTILDPIISSFAVADADTGSELLTNNATVDVAITGVAAVDPIAGYIVTESATPPDPGAAGWSGTTPPSSYTIQGGAGHVTLYAYAKDTSDVVSVGKPATIFYNPTAPAASDVLALGSMETSAAVLWNTDTEAYGRLKYRAAGEADWIYTDWELGHGTTHVRSMTGLVADTTYEYVVISNETEETAATYTHTERATEIPKAGITTCAVPDAPPVSGTGPATSSTASQVATCGIQAALRPGSGSTSAPPTEFRGSSTSPATTTRTWTSM